MSPVSLRPFAPDDLEATIATWHESKRTAFPYVPIQQAHTLDDDREFFRAVLLPRADAVWLAEEDGRLVGLLVCEQDVVDQLFVATSAQRRGVGTLLLEKARELHPEGLRLFTFQKNETARAFYEKHGFRAVRFGRSAPPEDEPDVEYRWQP